MIRGTTPTFTFTLPASVGNYKRIEIYVSQFGNLKITKTEKDCTLEGNTVKCVLTQDETLKLIGNEYADVQIRVLTNANEALASIVYRVKVNKLLTEGVIA